MKTQIIVKVFDEYIALPVLDTPIEVGDYFVQPDDGNNQPILRKSVLEKNFTVEKMYKIAKKKGYYIISIDLIEYIDLGHTKVDISNTILKNYE